MEKQTQERVLARQTARELSLDDIKNVSGAFTFPSYPTGGSSTSSNSKSTTCVNGVCKTVTSRDE